MGVGFLLGLVLLDELLRCFECISIFLALSLEGDLVLNFAFDSGLVFLALLHDVSQHILAAA